MKKYQTGGEIDPLTGLTVEAPEPTEIKVKKPRKRKPLNILESLDFSAIDPSEEEKAKTMERAKEMCRNASTLAYEYVSLEHRPTRECPRADKPEPQLDKQPLESCLQPSKLLPVQPGEAASWLPQQPAEQRVQASHAQVGNAPPQGQGTGSTQQTSAEFWDAEEKEYENKNRKWQGKQISNAMQGGTDQLDASDAMVAEPRDSQS